MFTGSLLTPFASLIKAPKASGASYGPEKNERSNIYGVITAPARLINQSAQGERGQLWPRKK